MSIIKTLPWTILTILINSGISGGCSTDNNCPIFGMKCYKEYKGCDTGTCRCPHGITKDGTACLDLNAGVRGSKCRDNFDCNEGLRCIYSNELSIMSANAGNCRCLGRLDENGICIPNHHRLLGQKCLKRHQKCSHKSGNSYKTYDVVCESGSCQCRPGLKRHGNSCRRVRLNEEGCVTSSDCSGDGVCHHNVCKCPRGFIEVIKGKCGQPHARLEIQERYACDEMIYKDRFCSAGLQCHRCGSDNNFRCWKYSSSVTPEQLLVGTNYPYPRSTGSIWTPEKSQLAFWIIISTIMAALL